MDATDAPKKTLHLHRLKEIAHYDPETGEFRSLVNRGPIKVGQKLGGIALHGYLHVQIDGRIYLGHRLAWLYVHGHWPEFSIDHIDGNRLNNTISNLRLAERSINQQNQRRPRSDNTSGYLGVSRAWGRWGARIKHGNKHKHLGLFDTPELAYQAYLSAKRQFHEGNTL